MVNAWKETSQPTILTHYDLKDIYNADEFGLFYKCMTDKTMPTQIRKVLRWKVNKIRIISMGVANVVGDP